VARVEQIRWIETKRGKAHTRAQIERLNLSLVLRFKKIGHL